MSQEYDWETDGSGATFFTGLVAGTLIGAGPGVLFAHSRGAGLRERRNVRAYGGRDRLRPA